jgi:hypothetical protein
VDWSPCLLGASTALMHNLHSNQSANPCRHAGFILCNVPLLIDQQTRALLTICRHCFWGMKRPPSWNAVALPADHLICYCDSAPSNPDRRSQRVLVVLLRQDPLP